MNLVEFLLARIAEDEAIAQAASPGGWQYGGVASVAGGNLYDETRVIADVVYEQPTDHDGSIVRHLLVPEADANGTHIARHDPARVLAECEAKRRLVELHAPDAPYCGWSHDPNYTHADITTDSCDTLLALAHAYADHTDAPDLEPI